MSYELVDAIGVQSIASIIKQSGLQKISVTKYGAGKGTIATFEDSDSKTNDRIVKGFTDWATTILHGNPFNDMVYEVLLYNDAEPDDTDEDTEKEKEKTGKKRGYGRANKMRFTIQLYRPGTAPGTEKITEKIEACRVNESLTPDKVSEMVKTMMIENEVMRRLSVVEIELRSIHERIDTVIDDVDEIRDEVNEIDGTNVSGAENDKQEYYFNKFIDLLNVKAANGTKLAGTPDNDTATVKANINKAIAILYKYDKKIDVHLLKLASLAETNKELFDKVVEQLEKM